MPKFPNETEARAVELIRAKFKNFRHDWTVGLVAIFAMGLCLLLAGFISVLAGGFLGWLFGLVHPDPNNENNGIFVVAAGAVPWSLGLAVRVLNQSLDVLERS